MKTEGGTLVFIYGTLRKGCRAHSKMGDSIFVCEATIKGKLVYVDRYPGFISGDSEVRGEVYRVSDATLRSLDEYEGCFCSPPLYQRKLRSCWKSDGTSLEVNIYVFQSEGSDEYNIDEGDWISFIKKYPQLNSFD